MFSGNQTYKVDAQGRLPIPPRWRTSFAGVAKVTRGEERALPLRLYRPRLGASRQQHQ